MTKKQHSILYFLGLLLFFILFLFIEKFSIRIDMTENSLYSLSDYSQNVYQDIPDTIHLRYYVSDQLRNMYPEPDEISNFISEYASYSKGKIRFSVIDPAKSGDAEMIKNAGLIEQQMQSSSQTRSSFVSVFSGILIEYLDTVSVIPFVFSVERLEYDISSRIHKLIKNTSPKIGIMSAGADISWEEDFMYFQQLLLAHEYQIQLLIPGAAIPDDISVLMVFDGVEELDKENLTLIDRFIQQGGSVFFAVEAVYIDTFGDLSARVKKDAGLLAMLEHYGVRIDPVLVMDRTSHTVPFSESDASGISVSEQRAYPHWIRIPAAAGNTQHPVTSFFGGLDLFWASPLMLDDRDSVQAEVLARSSQDSWLMLEPFITDLSDHELFSRDALRTAATFPLAVALSGVFPSWNNGTSSESINSKNARIIVVGDSDLVSTLMQYTESERNLEFMLSVLDWLSYNDDLLSIERKTNRSAHLDAILDESKRIKLVLFSQLLTVILIPLFLIAAGVFWNLNRKNKKESHNAV